jgi:hypothetical protein
MATSIADFIRERILAIPDGKLLPVTALGKRVVKQYPHLTLTNVYSQINRIMTEKKIAELYEKRKGRPKNQPKIGSPRTYIRKR